MRTYMCVCPQGAHGGQKGPSDLELQLAVESPSGCWELDSGPLQDQQASLTLSYLCRPNTGLFSPAPQSPEALCIIFLLLFRLDNLYLSPSSLTHSSVVCCSLLSLCGENLNFSIFFSKFCSQASVWFFVNGMCCFVESLYVSICFRNICLYLLES